VIQHDLLKLSGKSHLVEAEKSGYVMQGNNAPLLVAESEK